MPTSDLTPALTRRTFLAGGGAIIVYLAGCRSGLASSTSGPRTDGRVFTGPWLAITKDNHVVVFVDKCEMGQGVRHMFASIVAEELGLRPEAVVVEEADIDPDRYGNRYVVPEIHGIQLGRFFSLFQFQMTGGSSSAMDMCDEDKLWDTAARTRQLLKSRAAQRLGKLESEIELKDGVARVGNRTLRFAELVGDGQTPRTAAPKPSLEILGNPEARRERIDAHDKVTGHARFGFDLGPRDLESDGIFVPSLLVALVLRPSRSRDPIEVPEANKDAVGKMAGVKRLVELREGRGVAVVADSFWHADRARRALRPKPVTTAERADSTVILSSYDRALEECAVTLGSVATSPEVEPPWRTYVTPFGPHAPMEPPSAVCAKDPKGVYHIYAATQFPQAARAQAGRALGEPKSRVLIHGVLAGGAFGRRAASDFIVEVAEVCKAMNGAAVKLVWTREDDFRHDYLRPCAVSRVRAATSNATDSTITRWDHLLISESPHLALGKEYLAALGLDGVLGWVPPTWLPNWRSFKKRHGPKADPTIDEGVTNSIYEMGRDSRARVLPIPKAQTPLNNTVRVGYWRSVACFHNIFAVESRLDELAWETRSDPLTIRRTNLQRATADADAKKRQQRLLWCVDEVVRMVGDTRKLAEQGRGYGIACFSGWGSFAALAVRVEQGAHDPGEIRVRDAWAAVDCGFVLNPDVLCQQVEGGIVFGLSAALKQEITTVNGVVRETNFHACDSLRIHECPRITVVYRKYPPGKEPPTGVGELMTPLPAPAVANAVFNLTGHRLRRVPLDLRGRR